MIAKTISISDKGQIAIPTAIRLENGLSKGDNLLIISKNGRIYIEKIDRIAQERVDEFEDIRIMSEQSLREVWDNKEDDIYSQYIR